MPIVRDLKNRDVKKILSLKKENENLKKKTPSNILDLRGKKCSKKSKVAFDIALNKENKPRGYLFFPNKNKDSENKKKPKTELIRMVIFGVIIVFLINLMHIGNQLFSIASDIEANAFEGYSSIVEGGKDALNSNFGGAVQYFDSASHAFEQAKEEVWFLGNNGVMSSKESLGDSAYSILESGKHISDAASYFAQGISGLNEIPVLFLENNTKSEEELAVSNPVSITEKLKSSLNLVNKALNEVKQAKAKLMKAGPEFLPPSLRDHFDVLSKHLDELTIMLNDIQKRIPAILSMLGDRYPHRYLVLLQNNAESRPTGGFIGSYLIVDVNDGYITKVDFHDVYESDGQLHEFIPAPAELSLFTDNWRMRDSNYSPDFSLSAKKAAWFLEKEEGPGVDSVIAINQSILEDILTLTGPVKVEGLESELTADNYNTVLTYIIESKLEGEENPKEVLNRVIPAVQSEIYGKASFRNLLVLIQNGIKKKNIIGWSKNDEIQKFFQDVGMASLIKKQVKNEDYFSLTTINIGGNKSDLYMDSSILHETVIDKSGGLYDVVTYKRKHTWNPNIILEWENQLKPFGFEDIPDVVQNILGRGANKSIIKLYLPPGTELENTEGIEKDAVTVGYDEETNKAFMYFISEVEPQTEKEITLTYKLPFTLDLSVADEYRLTVQKQPGYIHDTAFKKRIISDPHIKNYRNYPKETVYKSGEALEFETTLTNDIEFGSLWGIE
jgi:hypothetical protein